MIFYVLSINPEVSRHTRVAVPSTLFVFGSGDFLVLPTNQKFNANKQVFQAKREKLVFNFKRCKIGQLPFMKQFCFLTVLLAWVVRRKFRLSPSRASIMRSLLTSNGWSLIYMQDDTYRVSLLRSKKLKLRFFRKLPSMTFAPADYKKLNHTTFTGLDIYFNVKEQ